jgi:hypothetical protein
MGSRSMAMVGPASWGDHSTEMQSCEEALVSGNVGKSVGLIGNVMRVDRVGLPGWRRGAALFIGRGSNGTCLLLARHDGDARRNRLSKPCASLRRREIR